METEFDETENVEETMGEGEGKPSFVYLLICSDGRASYVGATVDLDHRLRQHNGLLKGGAVATTSKLTKGRTWIRAGHVSGFPDWKSALQFEWRWKQISRKLVKRSGPGRGRCSPLENRLCALKELVALDKATTKAVPYSEWKNGPPQIHLETEEAILIFGKI